LRDGAASREDVERKVAMDSCEAAITFGVLVGAGIGLAATVLFILAAAIPKGALRRRHVLWLLAAVAVWGAYRTGADFGSCYAAAVSLAAAVVTRSVK
jgi:hypothetical protein